MFSNKQCLEEVLIQRAVKTTVQIFYDKGSFDSYPKSDKLLKVFCSLQDVNLT